MTDKQTEPSDAAVLAALGRLPACGECGSKTDPKLACPACKWRAEQALRAAYAIDRPRLEVRPEIEQFAALMEAELQTRDAERGDAWKSESLEWLLDRLYSEVDELGNAIENSDGDDGVHEIRGEAADVGNFAMFIAALAAAGGEHD